MGDSKKLRRFYAFACCPPDLERLQTGEFLPNILFILLTISGLGKKGQKWHFIRRVKLFKVANKFVMYVRPSVRMGGI
jgi:hypothetical protein